MSSKCDCTQHQYINEHWTDDCFPHMTTNLLILFSFKLDSCTSYWTYLNFYSNMIRMPSKCDCTQHQCINEHWTNDCFPHMTTNLLLLFSFTLDSCTSYWTYLNFYSNMIRMPSKCDCTQHQCTNEHLPNDTLLLLRFIIEQII